MSTIWDFRAKLYDLFEGSDIRRGPYKAAIFREAAGRVLFVAVGPGMDVRHFPPGREIVAIDISHEMLRRTSPRALRYEGQFTLLRCDAQCLCFSDESFDTAVTSCTLCSVLDPIRVLRELNRVLRPDGKLLMFEHVRSRNPIFASTLDLMTLWSRRLGTEMNRDTVGNAKAAGFRITRIESVFLDIILAVRAEKADAALLPTSREREAAVRTPVL